MNTNDNIPSNSHKSRMNTQNKQNETHTKSVIPKGKATIKKKGFIDKLCDSFMVDNVSDIKSTIVNDFLIPGCKDLIHDSLHNAIDLFFGGNGSTYNRGSTSYNRGRSNPMNKPIRSYDKQYNTNNIQSDRNRSVYDYTELEFSDRGSATMVLNEMNEYLAEYKVVTVATMYDLAAITTNNYMLNNYGWTDISSATIRPVKNGWLLSMPKPMPID